MMRVVLLLYILLLQGCTGFSFVFERLDFFSVWQLNRVFDLSEEQEKLLKPAAVEFREWLRTQAFPELIDELNAANTLWQKNQLEEAINGLNRSSDQFLSKSLDKMWPLLTPVITTLEEKNMAAFRSYAMDRQLEWYEDSKSDTTKLEGRIEDLEEWFGSLNDKQIGIVKSWVSLLPNEQAIRVTNDNQRREKFIKLSLAKDLPGLEPLAKNPNLWNTEDYMQWEQKDQQLFKSMVAELLPTLTKNQKRHASNRIQDWISKLESVTRT